MTDVGKEGGRLVRISSRIRKSIASEVNDIGRSNNLGMVSITKVTVSPDLRKAIIYFSLYGGETLTDRFIELVNLKSYFLQQVLGRKLRLKRTPSLIFVSDESLSKQQRLDQLLR